MNWIFIAILSGTIMTSSHDTEEACLGKQAIMQKENKITNSKCVDMRQQLIYSSTSNIIQLAK